MSSEPENIDAEYMNRWLGDNAKITSLSAKVLYDVQTLLEYYRDIIVPSVDVSISFPTENGSNAKASVEDSKVFIPYYMLRDGRVDETIGAMIHELHHIKWSASEKFTCALTFKYLRKLMENIDVIGMSLAERVFSDSTLTVDDIMSEKDGVPQDVMYMRKIIGDLMFMLNAVEDVRIDEKNPRNLLKYRMKHEKHCLERFRDAIDSEVLDPHSFPGFLMRALFHYKNPERDSDVEELPLKFHHIVDATPREYIPRTMRSFADQIQEHAGGLWEQFQEAQGHSCIDDFLAGEYFDDGEGSEAEPCPEMDLDTKETNSCKGVNPDEVDFARYTFGELDQTEFFDKAKELLNQKPVEKLVLSQDCWAEIEAFKTIEHIICKEPMANFLNGIEYDTLIVDCVK